MIKTFLDTFIFIPVNNHLSLTIFGARKYEAFLTFSNIQQTASMKPPLYADILEKCLQQ